MLVDGALVARLEGSAADLGVDLAEATAATSQHGTSRVSRMRQGALVALGPGRYVNRGLGLTVDELGSRDIDAIESFFRDAGAAPAFEVSSWASFGTMEVVASRGYAPLWFRNVYVRPVPGGPVAPSASGSDRTMSIAPVSDDQVPRWLDVFAAGNDVTQGAEREVADEFIVAAHAIEGSTDLLAWIGDECVGCASLQVVGGVAWLGAASTAPGFRRRGIQRALIEARIGVAREIGCDLLAATAVPIGSSARNLVRHGFSLSHVQVVVARPGNELT